MMARQNEELRNQIDASMYPEVELTAQPPIQHVDYVIVKLREELAALDGLPQDFSIYRVPDHIRRIGEGYYEPRLFSLGPYHRDKEHLHAMNKDKLQYLQDFEKAGAGRMEDYLAKMREMEREVRRCYFEDVNLTSDEFVEMLLVDGCFILQFFIRWSDSYKGSMFDLGWSGPLFLTDLCMLENQIPYMVLKELYFIYQNGPGRDITIVGPKPKLKEIILGFFKATYFEEERNARSGLKVTFESVRETDIKHLLHLYHCFLFPSVEEPGESPPGESQPFAEKKPGISPPPGEVKQGQGLYPRTILCASELKALGLGFRRKRHTNSFLDISFNEGCVPYVCQKVLEIPYHSIEDSTRSKYMNLIAFEQSTPKKRQLTSYAVFMDHLLNTAQDALILQRHRIIDNRLANDEELAMFFGQLRNCCNLDYDTHDLRDVFLNVYGFQHNHWRRERALFCGKYCSTPWPFLSVLIALTVLSFTIYNFVAIKRK